ncbi:MAG: SRPBCC family protein, partial [Actinomycetota bacterium]|nr:SRPBCC family protein [Actinomycetota bacterium]
KACTTPELVRKWWGAEMGEVTHAEIDLRVGGKWRYVQVANGGLEVAFHGEYREIVPNERIVSTEAYEGVPDPDANATVNTVTYEDLGGRTKMTVLVQCPSREVRDAIIESGMEVGMQKSYDALERVAQSLGRSRST